LVDIALLTFLVILGIAIIRLSSLFAAVMLTGLFSLVAAGLYVSMDAVDVAFTEAAVGGGIATMLFLSTIALTKSQEKTRGDASFSAFFIVVLTGIVLMYGVSDIPKFGDSLAPAHQYLSDRYVYQSPQEIGVPNMVTSVLASYRGYDTMGEVTVIFTALVAVLMLLGRGLRSSNTGSGVRERKKVKL
jgi:multicomponent Na+:H+ antiporter subunit B